MKKLMIIMFLIAVCSNAMAEITSDDFESYLDDLLDFLNLQRIDDDVQEDIDISGVSTDPSYTPATQTYTTSISSDIEPYLNDLPLTGDIGLSGDIFNPDQDGFDSSDSPVITNPEPCSIILSSIGLGVAGYLKRRRVI